jgi:hypothetical protein
MDSRFLASAVLESLIALAPACSARDNAPSSTSHGAIVGDEASEPIANLGSDGAAEAFAPDAPDESPVAEPVAYMRVAQLSPDLSAIDLCVAPHGSTAFEGPLVHQLADDEGGPDVGIAYGQVSAYLSLAPGALDVRIVAAGASDCASAIEVDGQALLGSPDVTDGAALAPSGYATLLIAGSAASDSGTQGVTVTLLGDDAVLAGGAASLRAINAMPSAPALDFGLGSFSTEWQPLLIKVAFGTASTQAGPSAGAVDANGYLPIEPLANRTMSARLSSGAAGDTAVGAVTTAPGTIATIVALGVAGDPAHPPALMLCADNAPSGGIRSDCSVAQP